MEDSGAATPDKIISLDIVRNSRFLISVGLPERGARKQTPAKLHRFLSAMVRTGDGTSSGHCPRDCSSEK